MIPLVLLILFKRFSSTLGSEICNHALSIQLPSRLQNHCMFSHRGTPQNISGANVVASNLASEAPRKVPHLSIDRQPSSRLCDIS